jgi:signal transduction histidine kinase
VSASRFSTLSRLRSPTQVDALVDAFIPPALAASRDQRQQARMFLISHIFGPFLGNTTLVALATVDPPPNARLAVLATSICGFWIFPFLLRAGLSYNALALASIENLIFCILCGVYCYGGVASPVLPWVLTIPLLAFLYLSATPKLWPYVLLMFVANCALFWVAYNGDFGLRLADLPFDKLQRFGLISTAAAAGYVSMMAIYYGKAVASQSDLEIEMRQHLSTAAELRRATEEAERAGAAKADFLARMSHELRTPLNAVIGYSQMMIEDADAEHDPEMAEDLGRIHGAGQQLLKLVNEVLDLSKIEAGRMELSPCVVNVTRMVGAVADQFRPAALAAGVALDLDCRELGTAWWDEAKSRQALSQLVDNAIKFTRQGGGVRIVARAFEEDGVATLRIAVEDSGVGISPSALSNLFEQFTAEDDASGSKYGGRGLGLALARKLARLMGGDVAVASQLGVGSVFTLSLPRGDARPSEVVADDRLADAEIARLRRLIVERPPAPIDKIA